MAPAVRGDGDHDDGGHERDEGRGRSHRIDDPEGREEIEGVGRRPREERGGGLAGCVAVERGQVAQAVDPRPGEEVEECRRDRDGREKRRSVRREPGWELPAQGAAVARLEGGEHEWNGDGREKEQPGRVVRKEGERRERREANPRRHGMLGPRLQQLEVGEQRGQEERRAQHVGLGNPGQKDRARRKGEGESAEQGGRPIHGELPEHEPEEKNCGGACDERDRKIRKPRMPNRVREAQEDRKERRVGEGGEFPRKIPGDEDVPVPVVVDRVDEAARKPQEKRQRGDEEQPAAGSSRANGGVWVP